MASRRDHQIAGILTACIYEICRLSDRYKHGMPPKGKDIMIGIPKALIAGSLGGCLADILEPAVHPNHRGFFHSYAIAAILILFCIKIKDSKFLESNPQIKSALYSLLLSYGSHLTLDAVTPKGLPVTGIYLSLRIERGIVKWISLRQQ